MAYSNSNLVTYARLTRNHSGERKYPITKIAIHHMAAVMTAKQCVDYFATTGREVSSNYCIGYDGSIGLSVEEKNRAWTTASTWCDQRAITIEVSNDKMGEPWSISNKSYKALIGLIVDICKRNGLTEISYTGGKDGVLQKHQWYANTNCPGQYLGSKFPDIVLEVNAKLAGTPYAPDTNKDETPPKDSGELYRVKVSALNIREKPTVSSKITGVIRDYGIYTIVDKEGAWGKLKSGAGWIHLLYAEKVNNTSAPKESIDTIAKEVIQGKWGNGQERKNRLTKAGYNYNEVQKAVNKLV